MSYIILLLSSIFGFSLNHLPSIKFKAIQVSPCLKISFKTKAIRVHRWMAYSILLIITITYSGGIFNNIVANGYFIGAIAQGLSFPDWRKIVDRK